MRSEASRSRSASDSRSRRRGHPRIDPLAFGHSGYGGQEDERDGRATGSGSPTSTTAMRGGDAADERDRDDRLGAFDDAFTSGS